MYVSPTSDGLIFQIKSYNSAHTYSRLANVTKVMSRWIVEKFKAMVTTVPDIAVRVIANELRRKYEVECLDIRLYTARTKALNFLGKDHELNYSKLYSYSSMISNSTLHFVALVELLDLFQLKNNILRNFYHALWLKI